MWMKMRFSSVLLFLALASVSRSVPAAKEQQEYSERWFLQAVSTESCIAAAAMSLFQWLTLVIDVRPKNQMGFYEVNGTGKMWEFCHDFQSMDVNVSRGRDVIIQPQTYCSDCFTLVAKKRGKLQPYALSLFSRREVVTMTDLRNFQIQASTLNLTAPFLFNRDYDKSNCKYINLKDPELEKHAERINSAFAVFENCSR